MCGIAGIVGAGDLLAARTRLESALNALRHRGPDDHGVFVMPPRSEAQSFVTLGSRRLSIIDLSDAARQPMVTQDGRFAIVLNGEVYNYRELRTELRRVGRQFRTQSDTEVLLEACAHWGVPKTMNRLVGMFAFAVVDVARRTLTLARDRFGIKPLFYAKVANGFAFASEIGALLQLPGVSRLINADRLYEYLLEGNTDHEHGTLLTNVRQLPAAQLLVVALDANEVSVPAPYWRLDLNKQVDLSFNQAAEQLRSLLFESVALHLRSDVPIGFALSGGVDSSAIVMIARELLGANAEMHGFSYLASDPRISERRHIEVVQRAASTIPHGYTDDFNDLPLQFDAVVERQGEPTATPLFVQWQLFAEARAAGVKVVLTGQGADEMLAGYNRFVASRVTSLMRQGNWREACRLVFGNSAPRARDQLRLAVQAGERLFPGSMGRLVAGLQKRKHGSGNWLHREWFAERGAALPPPWKARSSMVLREHLHHAMTRFYLPALLRYDDRNAMASSIENRVPFLTRSIAEFLFALPEEYALARDGTRKALLRQALRGLVPATVLDRRDKIGFAMPVSFWLTKLGPWVSTKLDEAAALPCLAAPELQALRDRAQSGQPAAVRALWRCISLAGWAKKFEVEFK